MTDEEDVSGRRRRAVDRDGGARDRRHAAARGPLIGTWCSVVGYDFDVEKGATFERGPEDCAGGVLVKPNGYDGIVGHCYFFDVRRLPDKTGYVIHADCRHRAIPEAETPDLVAAAAPRAAPVPATRFSDHAGQKMVGYSK